MHTKRFAALRKARICEVWLTFSILRRGECYTGEFRRTMKWGCGNEKVLHSHPVYFTQCLSASFFSAPQSSPVPFSRLCRMKALLMLSKSSLSRISLWDEERS